MKIIPSAHEVLREAVIVVAGGLLAAVIINAFPGLRAWMREQWQGAKP